MQRFPLPLAVLLCVSVSIPSAALRAKPDPAQSRDDAKRVSSRPASHPAELLGDARILHALSRFTFGPRPGDLEAVRSTGLEKWFDQQLHPGILDETDLNARLSQFPAMQETPQELLARLPSYAVIRQAANGKAPIPEAGVLHAIYKNQIARFELRRQSLERKSREQVSISANNLMAAGAITSADTGAMAAEPAQTGQSTEMNPSQMNMSSPETMSARPSTESESTDPALLDNVLAFTPQQRVARLAAMSQPEHDAFYKALKPKQRAALMDGLNPVQKEQVAALENPEQVVVQELAWERLTRDIYSQAQLQEVMTDFWLNHFNVYLHKDAETPYYLVSYERDVIRPHALGKFEDLLEATAHSPAMLLYLDNAGSAGPDSLAAERARFREARFGAAATARQGLNENYARELMELHTLGVNGGYTQADVIQVARIFTGWSVDRPQRGGGFKFEENRHEPGTKKVLGKKFKEHGEQEGRQLLHMLATHPATARFLCRELAVRFVSDDPPQGLVDRMAKSYLFSGGDISTVLRTLFHSPEFWSESVYQAKVKTPIEFVVSAVRASQAATDNVQPLVNALRNMGMPLYGAVPPTGYNWDAATWVSTGQLVDRMNFALALAADSLPGITVNWSQASPAAGPAQQTESAFTAGLTSGSVVGPAAEAQRLEFCLIPGGVSQSTHTALVDQTNTPKTQAAPPAVPIAVAARPMNPAQAAMARERQDQRMAGLLLGSPEFQRR
jgi:uncharacterized protein (DUF1800 family)